MTLFGQPGWLLDELIEKVPHTRQAVLLSADGLLIGASRGLSREDGEHLAAMASGFASLARSASRHFNAGAVRQTLLEMEDAFLFISTAGRSSCLAVLAGSEADIGLISYEMALLVTRVGDNFSVAHRAGVDGR
ncbi:MULTISPECIES: roadblock/LC7 domain-containing protein [Catenuloplanes]|uniref:Regulator of Ras-like GTPase activity (Roadblock/LC7/MglB family) n=3 Tax=Catenuloplanes TaxID=33874 RepID=A0AAE4CSU1_9ACTN|nr:MULTISPECIES: roadblock/LC7 domain-containing protein [Catenuloplanes]MDP9797523.1 putative regulator of Ras-like GTPase activity (Roadblock/LC7/MglB family) [Catenuloplanes nepalensis]MDQ0368733.1 putative regulator of Ras-like GTPase activity (Roadblock/LC7/MglB family) [Catenuloplanes indicus]MDR7324551.1 putative regulator of Ras-like GTPase activity (Roadblock/LC7/MglB family) [Catenuloplanes niger]